MSLSKEEFFQGDSCICEGNSSRKLSWSCGKSLNSNGCWKFLNNSVPIRSAKNCFLFSGVIITACNEVAGRYCFCTCMSFCSPEGLCPEGESLSRRGVSVRQTPSYSKERVVGILLECILFPCMFLVKSGGWNDVRQVATQICQLVWY